MKYDVLKRSHLKRNIIIALIVVGVISAIILNFTRAKYRTTQSMPLLNGTINYTLADLNIVAMYLDGSEIDTLPDGNYELTEESYCTNEENVKDESITLSYDSSTKGLSVSPMTKKGTKCYLYFEEKLCPEGATACDTIVAASKPQGQTTDWTGQTTYYYTGKPDNWVQFAGFFWRIIRINGNGSIRMIYQGTSANETGTGTQIGTGVFNSDPFNKTYVGLVYDGTNQHGSGTPSTIMNTLNTWYNNNLASYEEKYIDTGTGFCSDRNIASGENYTDSSFHYAPSDRDNYGENNGSLQCHDDDILSQDNGKIPNPIGLLTSDEYVLARRSSSYLNVKINYWTMSPYWYGNGLAYVFRVYDNGSLSNDFVHQEHGVRPVINLKSTVALEGDGSVNTPFKIVGT